MQFAWTLGRRRPALSIESKQVTRIAHLISLRGDIGPEDAERIERRLRAIGYHGGVEIVVDLSAAGPIDHTVAEALLRAATELRKVGGELRLAAADERGEGYVLKAVGPEAPVDLLGLHRELDSALEAGYTVA